MLMDRTPVKSCVDLAGVFFEYECVFSNVVNLKGEEGILKIVYIDL